MYLSEYSWIKKYIFTCVIYILLSFRICDDPVEADIKDVRHCCYFYTFRLKLLLVIILSISS